MLAADSAKQTHSLRACLYMRAEANRAHGFWVRVSEGASVTWTTKVCKRMAQDHHKRPTVVLFYILALHTFGSQVQCLRHNLHLNRSARWPTAIQLCTQYRPPKQDLGYRHGLNYRLTSPIGPFGQQAKAPESEWALPWHRDFGGFGWRCKTALCAMWILG